LAAYPDGRAAALAPGAATPADHLVRCRPLFWRVQPYASGSDREDPCAAGAFARPGWA